MCRFCDNISIVENRDPMAQFQIYLVPIDGGIALIAEHLVDDETSFFFGTMADFCPKCGRDLRGGEQ